MILAKGADVSSANKTGELGSHFAAAHGNNEILKLLVAAHPACATHRNNRKATPLHGAARNMNQDCINLLLEAGADPNLRDEDGATPLVHSLRNAFMKKQDDDDSDDDEDDEAKAPAQTGLRQSFFLIECTHKMVHGKCAFKI